MLYFCSQRVTKHIAQPIISFNYGAGNRYRVRRAIRVSFATATICGVLATMFLTSDAVHVTQVPYVHTYQQVEAEVVVARHLARRLAFA